MFGEGDDDRWRIVERDETRVISIAENMGLVCHGKKHKNLVELWEGYKLERGIIIFGKTILMVLENG